MCGRTLLDTIEHVLDFSKIKKFGQEAMQPLGVVADLDVSAVIEEVLEGVYAGFEFNGWAICQFHLPNVLSNEDLV